MITKDILTSFIYKKADGTYEVTDPSDFNMVLVGGPFKTKKEASASFKKFVKENQIEFV